MVKATLWRLGSTQMREEVMMLTFEEFANRIRAAGFAPSDDALREMWVAYPALERMRHAVRRDFGYEDDLAHVYRAAHSLEGAK